jgi:hypothetical protein
VCPFGATEDPALAEIVQWYRRARTACEPFMFAEARFRTPWVDDEFAATIRVARQWLCDHPCPDRPLGQHFDELLGAYGEMASATVARAMELRMNIEEHVKALDRWKTQTLALVDSPAMDSGVRVQRERRSAVRVPLEGRAG